jgi:HEAT repeat protein
MLKASEPSLRWEAAAALGRIGSTAKSAIPELTKLVGDEHAVVRRRAAQALGELGSEAKAAFGVLLQAQKNDRSSAVQDAAAEALWKIDAEEAKKAGVP